jgi:hypothetical protein
MKYWIVLLLYLNGFILSTLASSYNVEQSYFISQESWFYQIEIGSENWIDQKVDSIPPFHLY